LKRFLSRSAGGKRGKGGEESYDAEKPHAKITDLETCFCTLAEISQGEGGRGRGRGLSVFSRSACKKAPQHRNVPQKRKREKVIL